jgi:CheY-like chemotaxis protein
MNGQGAPSQIEIEEQGFPPAKILLVDDLRPNLLAITALLEPLGHEIVEATSGAKALEIAEREEFAVILLDIMMPRMDGFEVLERLHLIPLAHHTPVILQTAYDLDRDAIERAYTLGAVDYVRKPTPPSLLRGKVGALASLYRRGETLRSCWVQKQQVLDQRLPIRPGDRAPMRQVMPRAPGRTAPPLRSYWHLKSRPSAAAPDTPGNGFPGTWRAGFPTTFPTTGA